MARFSKKSKNQTNDMAQQAQVTRNVQKRPVSAGKAFALGLLAAFLVTLLASAALIFVSSQQSSNEQSNYNQMLSDAVNEVRDSTSMVSLTPQLSIRSKAVDPSVNITVIKNQNGTEGGFNNEEESHEENAPVEEPEQPLPEEPAPEEPQELEQQPAAAEDGNKSYGSGIIVNSDGNIVTNYHVIKGASNIIVTFKGIEYDKVDVIGYDESSDLAVIKIDAKDLPVAQIGQSASVVQGDWCMSVGNPYNMNDSMTSGIISALHRNFVYNDGRTEILYANMIQTTSLVSEGSSGSGLYDANGNLIGINTLVAVDDASVEKFGYAIPIDLATPIIQQLMAGATGSHASLGMSYANVPQDIVNKYGLQDDDGALVTGIIPSGPAEAAGIVVNDVIIRYNEQNVKNAQDLIFKIRASKINDTANIVLLREGKEMQFTVKIGSDA